MRRRAHDGEPFSVLNADAPQELLRAFDLPFVVNQWWASIVAAKQHSARYLQRLREHGYPTDAEPYSAQGLAAGLDPADKDAPWGGLPTPGLLMAVNGTAATAGIFRSWAAQASARLVLFDRTAEKRVDVFENWWDRLPVDWDRALEPDRLDLLESQLVRAIATLEAFSGRRFDEARLQ
ncbi:MAG: 2-hydroxyacyl-CoA dehydratase [Rubrivivax sp.]|nr:2-hydroxyacyl-CoA dehydratase [Rubrivivax sp.]